MKACQYATLNQGEFIDSQKKLNISLYKYFDLTFLRFTDMKVCKTELLCIPLPMV